MGITFPPYVQHAELLHTAQQTASCCPWAIARRPHESGECRPAAQAVVVYQYRLTQSLSKLLGQWSADNVGGTAWRKGDDVFDWLSRPILRQPN